MRPIREPSLGQRTGEHAHAIRQLQRRPSPNGALSWAMAKRTTSQAIDTGSAEYIVFGEFYTNDSVVFQLASGSDGILVTEIGVYETFGMIEASGHTTTSRGLYVQAQPLSVHPTFGTEYGATVYALDSSLLDDTNLRQNHHAVSSMGPTPTDPTKVTLVAERIGAVNWNATASGLMVVKIGSAGNL